ncbi:MAG: Lrp/AsnC family transcriptional regulator [Candidatus Njordarchaeia archaeon]
MIPDDKDMKILELLQKDSRLSYTDISKVLKITEAAVRKRVSKLVNNGVIRRFTIIPDHVKLGFRVVSLTGIDAQPDKLFSIAKKISEKTWAKKVYITAGDHSIMAEIWAKDNEEFSKIIHEIEQMDGVIKICPAMILEAIKE